MSLEFNLDIDGQEVKTSAAEAAEFLRQDGVPVMQLGQDGQTAFVQTPDGQLAQMNLQDLLQEHGLAVTGARPMNSSNEMFSPKYRFLTERLGNDEQRRQVLQLEMQQQGIQDASIVGSGDDWYAFDPRTSQYYALTNKPGLDTGDLAAAAGMVATGVGATLGGVGGAALGAPTGPGAIATGALGAGAGAGLAEEAMQGLAAGISPGFREVQSLRGALMQGGKEALMAAPFGALGGAGTWASKVLPKMAEEGAAMTAGYRALGAAQKLNTILGTGAVSPAMKGIGATSQAAGGLVGEAAGAIANNPLARTLGTGLIPGLSQAQMAGVLMEAPKWLHMAGAKAPRWIAGKMNKLEAMNPDWGAILPSQEIRKGMQDWTERVLTRQPANAPWAKLEESLLRGNLRARGMSEEQIAKEMSQPRSQDVFGNIVSDVSQKVSRFAKPEDQKFIQGAADIGRQAGTYLGRGMDAMARVGKNISTASEEAFGAGLRGLQGAGRAAQYGGRTLKNVGTITQPYEGRVAGRFGEEELAAWLDKRLNGRQSPNSTIGDGRSVLASY